MNKDNKKTTNADPILVTVKEAGRLLGIGPTKVFDLLYTRELPSVKIGRARRIELAAVHAYVDLQRIGNAPGNNR